MNYMGRGQMKKDETTSFGEYYDAQHARIVKAMQNKNAQLNIEWLEEYEKRKKDNLSLE